MTVNPVNVLYNDASGNPVAVDANNPLPVTGSGAGGGFSILPYPAGATPVAAASITGANQIVAATMPAVPGQFNYVTSFTCTAAGSTAALVVIAQLTGVVGGPMTYMFTFPLGATVSADRLTINFDPPLRSSAVNTACVITLPAGGAGNTHAACNIQGYSLA